MNSGLYETSIQLSSFVSQNTTQTSLLVPSKSSMLLPDLLKMSIFSTYGAGLTGFWSPDEVNGAIKRFNNECSALLGAKIVVFLVFTGFYICSCQS